MPENRLANTNNRRGRTPRIVAALLGAAAALVVVGVVMIFISRSQALPRVDRQRLEAAMERWAEAGPENYHIEYTVTGRQAAEFSVTVSGGKATKVLRNGRPIERMSTWTFWTVRGLLSVIAEDLKHVERHAAGGAEPTTPNLVIRGRFDEEYGYPAEYQQIDLGAGTEFGWKVTEFEVR